MNKTVLAVLAGMLAGGGAIAAYQAYQATLADGRVASADERRIALAAAAFLQLQCGWSPVGPATATKGTPLTDSNGVPYLIP